MAIDPKSPATATAIVAAANSGRATAAVAAAPPSARPISPQIAHPIPIRVPSSSPWAPYPVASSGGRGFRPVPADQSVTVANFSYPPPPAPQPHGVRPFYLHPQTFNSLNLASVKSLPPPPPLASNPQPSKVASSVPESNGYKDMSEKGRDDTLIVVRDRKVRLIEGRSLYSHCRSWLKNGFPEESQPQYGDTVRSLPKPASIPLATGNLLKQEGEDEEEEEKNDQEGVDDAEEEDGESVEHLSAEDLFKRHVKRAKKVRARLREVRLKRIARYKSRLALLLPPLVEQFRNDASAGGT